jgi:hypothetical protein
MFKPKAPKVNVRKVDEAKSYNQHGVKKVKPQKFQAKSQKTNCNKYTSWHKNSEQIKSLYDRNRQWNNFDTSMLISSYRSYIPTSWG